jgi:hypothetical protein
MKNNLHENTTGKRGFGLVVKAMPSADTEPAMVLNWNTMPRKVVSCLKS